MVNRTGLIEVPMGITLGEIIYEIGGGIPDGRKFKAVQTGGPLGGCLPRPYLDTPVDFDSLRAAGAVMGSGGMIVADETTCMVEFSKYFMKFVCDESAASARPAASAAPACWRSWSASPSGHGELEDLDRIRHLAEGMQKGSLCARWASWPRRPCSRRCATSRRSSWRTSRKGAARPQLPDAGALPLRQRVPGGVDVPAYLALVAQGRYAEALAVHRDANPFAPDLRPRAARRSARSAAAAAISTSRSPSARPSGLWPTGCSTCLAAAQDGAAEAHQGGGGWRRPVRA